MRATLPIYYLDTFLRLYEFYEGNFAPSFVWDFVVVWLIDYFLFFLLFEFLWYELLTSLVGSFVE